MRIALQQLGDCPYFRFPETKITKSRDRPAAVRVKVDKLALSSCGSLGGVAYGAH